MRLTLVALAGCGGLLEPVDVEPSDASTPVFDAHRDVVMDASAEAGDASCVVGSTSAFMPETLPPPSGKHQNKCTPAMLDFYTACTIDQDMNACTSPQPPTFKDCLACLESTAKDATWGPVVYADPMTMYFNIEGCVNLATGQSGATSCGQRLHALYGCERYLCEECQLPFPKCVAIAESAACKKYADAFALHCGDLTSYPEADNCFRRANEMDSRALRIRMDAYFCGP